MVSKIISRLKDIEKKAGVKIFYAAESGSRGWGFASGDSDYDVRFICVHKPEWYLSLEKGADVIEYPKLDMLDIVGWDIVKALKLFKNSNPPLFEWLSSPIVYQDAGSAIEKMRSLLPKFYSPKSCLYHYLSMAKKAYKAYLVGEKIEVKKYFYALRPILACMWIESQKSMPPMEFGKLLRAQNLGEEFTSTINELLKRKRQGSELGIGKKIKVVNNFLEEKITYFENYAKKLKVHNFSKSNILDNLFRDTLKEYWGYKRR